jgi:hypothetical protein
VRYATILLISVLSAGCVTTAQKKEKFSQDLDSWIGKSADDLVVAKGPPTSTFQLSSGGRVFEYSKSGSVTSGGGSYTINQTVYKPGAGGGTWEYVPQQKALPTSTHEYSCKVVFKVSAANVVESWTSEGNRCY